MNLKSFFKCLFYEIVPLSTHCALEKEKMHLIGCETISSDELKALLAKQ